MDATENFKTLFIFHLSFSRLSEQFVHQVSYASSFCYMQELCFARF